MDEQRKKSLKAVGLGEAVDAIESGFCPFCDRPIVIEDFKDVGSLKEFKISGICQSCQDKVFKEGEIR